MSNKWKQPQSFVAGLLSAMVITCSLQNTSAGVSDSLGLSGILSKIGNDRGDTIFSVLYDLEDRVDNLEASTTNIQYVTSALAGNQVAITAPALTDLKSTLSASISNIANDYIFTDPANGISYSVVNYDPVTDELTLFMRKIIGEYRQDLRGTRYELMLPTHYVDSNGHYTEGYMYSSDRSIVPSGCRMDVTVWNGPNAQTFFNNWVKSCSSKGILTAVQSVSLPLDTKYISRPVVTSMLTIPELDRKLPSGSVKDSYWDRSNRTSDYSGDSMYYTSYINAATGSGGTVIFGGYPSSGMAFYDEGLRGVAVTVKLKGDLGECNAWKNNCTDWLKMSNTTIGTTGIGVFCRDYLAESVAADVGTLHRKDDTYKYAHHMYINDSENNLTSTVKNALLTGSAGARFSIPYTSTMSTKTFKNEATLGDKHSKYVDVIIRDADNSILYFGRAAKVKLGDNMITFDLPSDLQEDVPYLLQMFEESYYDHQGISTISTPVNAKLVISN